MINKSNLSFWGLFALTLVTTGTVFAAPPFVEGGIKVQNVFVVSGMHDELVIMGAEFDNGGPPGVTLAGFPPLMVISNTPTEIVAQLPGGIPDGDYLLTVSTGSGANQSDSYDLTIGAVGPQGPTGPTGAAGPPGPGDGHSLDAADGSPADAVFVNNDGIVGIFGEQEITGSAATDHHGLHAPFFVDYTDANSGQQNYLKVWGAPNTPEIRISNAPKGVVAPVITLGQNGDLFFPPGAQVWTNRLRSVHHHPLVLQATTFDAGEGIDLRNNTDQTLMHVDISGNVGIGTVTPVHPLEMGSGAHVTAGGVWTNASSRDFKEDILSLELPEALEAFKALKPVKYKYKNTQDERHLGFIAEDVPDLVASEDRRSLSPMDIVALLTRVVQKLQADVERLEAELAASD